MFKRNLDVREAKGKIPLWVIAERLNIHVTTLNGWMRQEMDAEKKGRIMGAIAAIKEEFEVAKEAVQYDTANNF
jgi:hypothetical protein